jgi:hypothetical protein
MVYRRPDEAATFQRGGEPAMTDDEEGKRDMEERDTTWADVVCPRGLQVEMREAAAQLEAEINRPELREALVRAARALARWEAESAAYEIDPDFDETFVEITTATGYEYLYSVSVGWAHAAHEALELGRPDLFRHQDRGA